MFYFLNTSSIIKITFSIFIIVLLKATAYSEDVVLTWDRPDDARVTGYEIFYGPPDTNFKSSPKEIITSPEQTECDIFGLISGQIYAFAAKSIDGKGNESNFSEILSYDVLNVQNNDANDETQDENSKEDGQGESSKKDIENEISNKDAQDESSSDGGGGCFITSTNQ